MTDTYRAIGERMSLDTMHPQMVGCRRSRHAIQSVVQDAQLAHDLNSTCETMTERAASFLVLTKCADSQPAYFTQARDSFYKFGKAEGATVLDIWFQIQAMNTK